MTKTTHNTREGWLIDAVIALDKTFFKENGYELPEKLQVSCGFPRGTSKAIGQCWDPKVSGDKTTQMFVCPSQGDPITVLGIVLHEMIHASVGVEVGHKGIFRKLAKEFGFVGKMTATQVEPGSPLNGALNVIHASLGEYPHAPMQKRSKVAKRTGWIRLMSPEVEEYRALVSPAMLDEHGVPRDPWGNEMVPVS